MIVTPTKGYNFWEYDSRLLDFMKCGLFYPSRVSQTTTTTKNKTKQKQKKPGKIVVMVSWTYLLVGIELTIYTCVRKGPTNKQNRICY